MKFSRKAISPSVSSMLLVILAVLILIIILLWFLGFFSESIIKFNSPIERVCNQIKFKAALVNAEGTGFPELQISNIGSIQIYDFSLRYKRENGRVETSYIGRQLDPGNSISIELIPGTVETIEIQIIPILLGSTKGQVNKQKICSDNDQLILLKQVNH